MVATNMLSGGRRTKKKGTHRKLGAAAKKTVSVATRYVAPGDKAISRDKLHKCGKVIKSGKHKGKCKVVLSKVGQKVRARQLAKRSGSKKSRSHHKKKK